MYIYIYFNSIIQRQDMIMASNKYPVGNSKWTHCTYSKLGRYHGNLALLRIRPLRCLNLTEVSWNHGNPFSPKYSMFVLRKRTIVLIITNKNQN